MDLAAKGIEEGVALLPEAVTVGRALTVTLAALCPAAVALLLFQKKAVQAAKAAKEQREKDEAEILGQFFRATDALGLRPADPNAPEVQRRHDRLGIPLLSR